MAAERLHVDSGHQASPVFTIILSFSNIAHTASAFILEGLHTDVYHLYTKPFTLVKTNSCLLSHTLLQTILSWIQTSVKHCLQLQLISYIFRIDFFYKPLWFYSSSVPVFSSWLTSEKESTYWPTDFIWTPLTFLSRSSENLEKLPLSVKIFPLLQFVAYIWHLVSSVTIYQSD